MILLDTHVWLWWVSGSAELDDLHHQSILAAEQSGVGVSIISCWEIAKKVETGKFALDRAVDEWIERALAYPGMYLIDLTPEIVVESTQLPSPMHRDPADQMIVATARILGLPLLTADTKLLAYPYVETIAPRR